MLEAIELPHCSQKVVIGLYTDVQNTGFLKQQLLDGNTAFQYAFLDASVIVSRQALLAACFRAVNDLQQQRLKTRNVHSEIVLSLSPNNNHKIAESFRRFGISDSTKHIVAVKVGMNLESVQQHLGEHVQGQLTDLSDETLSSLHDVARIIKIYRLEAGPKKETLSLKATHESFILGSIALRGS